SQISEATSLSIDEQKERGINLSQLENEANDIEKEISRKSDDYKKILDEKNITLQDIQKELKPNDAVIEYIDFRYYDKKWTDTIYYCALIVKPEYINPVLVKLCTLDELKEFFIFPSEDKESYVNNPQKNHSLYKLIFQPLEEYLAGVDNIYISPTGILNKVSFSSLIDSELKSRNQLLLDRYNINYPGNIKDIVKKDDIQNKLSQKTAVVFGGIKYDLDSAALLTTSSKFRGEIDEKEFIPEGGIIIQDNISYGKFNYLPGSLEEANIITDILKKNNFTVTEYTGEEAVEEAFKTHNFDKAPQILHISTHGFFFPEPDKKYEKSGITESRQVFRLSDNPLFRSGLVFAGANRIFTGGSEIEGVENGILTAYEVSNMDLSNVELVVLSACETGLGDIKGGEGVFGLQRAFKTAGVKTIIMSKWKVPDEQTVELMQLFYSNWLDKQMDKYTAFREAQKQMSKKYEPYFWAAFIIQ
ncbi:MAG: CHAT domain-containing protein, partial [Ignavibacteria bacterium]|nr:CHAT domain-containing protein [Ignavibacteria bacterium]